MNNTTPELGSGGDSPGAISPPMESAGPSREQILAELDAVLHSEVFAGAARQQRLLRHLVLKRLDGSLGDLKEYTLGVEVFDRGDDFDPRLDPIVRVEASRLRSRLQKYYDSPGATGTLRISLPRGAYVPSFTYPEAAAAIGASPVATEAPPPPIAAIPAAGVSDDRRQRLRLATALAAVVVLGAAIWMIRQSLTPSVAPRYLRFQRITSAEVLCTSPTYSPDDRSIAYARRDAGTWHIYRRDLAGTAWTELTPGANEDDYQPAWSPDGKQIAFRSEREGGGLFSLATQSRSVSRLTTFGYNPSWSPDGSRVAFATGTFSDPAESASSDPSVLEILDVPTHRIRQVTGSASSYAAMQPAWSPHGRRIAYWDTSPNGDRDIWTIDADTASAASARPVPVTHDAWTDWSPAWSPDGNYLYFSSDRGGAMNLWRVRISERSGRVSGDPEPVTTPSSYTGWTTFAHSGKQFAYVRRTPYSELYKSPLDLDKGLHLSDRTSILAGARSMHEPDTSPDGRWIVLRIQDPQEDLALVRSDGANFHRLTNDVFNDRDPRWSPDGKLITFTSNRSHRFELWSIRPDGTRPQQLTKNGVVAHAWAPDGTLVAYPPAGSPYSLYPPGAPVKDWGLPSVFRPLAWSPDHDAVVGRMRTNGFGRGALFILTPSTEDYWEIASSALSPSAFWLHSGKELLFSRSDGIYLADVRGHELREEISTVRSDIHSRFTVSPDNQSFFFVQSDDEEDIWTGSR